MWAGTGCILLAIICSLLFVKKPLGFPPQTLTALYITHILKDIGFGIIASAILMSGFNRLKYNEKKTTGYLATIVGVLLFVLMIGSPAILSNMLSTIQTNTSNISKLLIDKQSRALTRSDLSLADKAHIKKALAQEEYFQDGAVVEYADEKGNTVRYQPTANDLQMRETHLFSLRMIMILRIEMIFWIIVFIATLTGSIIFYKK